MVVQRWWCSSHWDPNPQNKQKKQIQDKMRWTLQGWHKLYLQDLVGAFSISTDFYGVWKAGTVTHTPLMIQDTHSTCSWTFIAAAGVHHVAQLWCPVLDQTHLTAMILPSGNLTYSNGKWTFWRCIPYWKWGFSIAMFDYRRVTQLRCEKSFGVRIGPQDGRIPGFHNHGEYISPLSRGCGTPSKLPFHGL